MITIQIRAVQEKPEIYIEEEIERSVTPLYIAALAVEKLACFANDKVNLLQVYLDSGAEFTNDMNLENGQRLYVANKVHSEDTEPIIRLCMLGPKSAGKSALTLRFTNNVFQSGYDPTIEDAYRKQVYIDGQLTTLDILVTAGQEDYNVIRSSWYRKKDGFIIVFALNSQYSLEGINKFRDEIINFYLDYYDQQPIPPILVVGNKADLLENSDTSLLKNATEMVKDWGAGEVLRTSAKTGLNVEAMFANMVRSVRRNRTGKKNPKKTKRSWCSIL